MQQEMGNGTGLLAISCIVLREHRDLRLPHSTPRGANLTLTLGVSLGRALVPHIPQVPSCCWSPGPGRAFSQGGGGSGACRGYTALPLQPSWSPSVPPFLPLLPEEVTSSKKSSLTKTAIAEHTGTHSSSSSSSDADTTR